MANEVTCSKWNKSAVNNQSSVAQQNDSNSDDKFSLQSEWQTSVTFVKFNHCCSMQGKGQEWKPLQWNNKFVLQS